MCLPGRWQGFKVSGRPVFDRDGALPVSGYSARAVPAPRTTGSLSLFEKDLADFEPFTGPLPSAPCHKTNDELKP
jgi:hypothetical protein